MQFFRKHDQKRHTLPPKIETIRQNVASTGSMYHVILSESIDSLLTFKLGRKKDNSFKL